MSGKGRFFVVNAGPGARENITLRGYEVLRSADLVIASESQRERFAADLAGKQVIDGGHSLFTEKATRRGLSEEEVEQRQTALLDRIDRAYGAGETIVLLESGDIALFSPYRGYMRVFAHLEPELIPGLSAFNAVNALLARPLLTEQEQRLQLSGLAALMQADPQCLPDTWALFCMGLDLPQLVDRIQFLYPADTQVGIVVDAGYPEPEVIRCSVAGLDRYRDREISFPYCMIYIGLREW